MTINSVSCSRRISSFAGAVAILACPAAASAQESSGLWSGFRVQIGMGGILAPAYEGASSYRMRPLPIVRITYKDIIFLNGPSLGANLFRLGKKDGLQVKAGPLVAYRGGRDQDTDDALQGLGDIDPSIEVGGFVRMAWRGFSAEIKALHDVSDGHGGTLVAFGLGYTARIGKTAQVGATISSNWASESYMQSFFGVSPTQASRSRYQAYNAGTGFKDVSLGINATLRISGNWSVFGLAVYKRLVGDAADSPIVRTGGSRNQFAIGIGISYGFDLLPVSWTRR